ncbi:hypothetical protein B0H14DRAFT_2583563 [Mycena olivaceomarginata]|nr:hypothetical protein B0H14DRAFT_2583563 [Mycena olivaceomarginata]
MTSSALQYRYQDSTSLSVSSFWMDIHPGVFSRPLRAVVYGLSIGGLNASTFEAPQLGLHPRRLTMDVGVPLQWWPQVDDGSKRSESLKGIPRQKYSEVIQCIFSPLRPVSVTTSNQASRICSAECGRQSIVNRSKFASKQLGSGAW